MQLLERGAVDRASLALVVGRVRPAHVRAFVPLDAQPAQPLEDRALELLGRALGVGVLVLLVAAMSNVRLEWQRFRGVIGDNCRSRGKLGSRRR